jgi:hypothetical protein
MDEEYFLDEAMYKSFSRDLLDIQHDMDVLKGMMENNAETSLNVE